MNQKNQKIWDELNALQLYVEELKDEFAKRLDIEEALKAVGESYGMMFQESTPQYAMHKTCMDTLRRFAHIHNRTFTDICPQTC